MHVIIDISKYRIGTTHLLGGTAIYFVLEGNAILQFNLYHQLLLQQHQHLQQQACH